MSDAIIKPSTSDDLVIQNDDGSAKIEINENATIVFTGEVSISSVSDISTTTTGKIKQKGAAFQYFLHSDLFFK